MSIILILGYLLAIVYITCFRAPSILSETASYPFWSYVKAFSGNKKAGLEILENILLFVPLGYLFRQAGCKKKWTILTGLALSVTIELIQLAFHLGLFEFDDIFNNTIGTFVGALAYDWFKLSDFKRILITGAVVLVSLAFCIVFWKPENEAAEEDFYFGVESYSISNRTITLNGACFIYEKPEEGYNLVLESDDMAMQFSLSANLPSEAINEYYKCDQDYSNTGYTATAVIDPAKTYKIKVQWDNYIPSDTGVYIKNGEVVRTMAEAPDYSGMLLVAEPSHDFYVYQIDGNLYWLCGPGFMFEDDGTTRIQYSLHTTQIENLPVERLVHEWYWDDIEFDFEDYEIEPFGQYRVAKHSIPTEYSVTAMYTGYYKNGEWLWRDCFRPVVYDLPGFPYVR